MYNHCFDRLCRLYGTDNLKKFISAHVLICGLGGVGSWAAEAVARTAIGRITLADFDIVGETNINRHRTPFAYRYIVTPGRQNTSIVESDGAESEIEPETLFVYSKSFSTTIIQEGIGLNADYSYGNILKLNGRVGWGFRQDLNPFAYDISQLENDYEISRLSYFTSLYGPEFYFYFSWFPFSFFEIKEEFDALLPVDNVDNFSFLSRSTVSIWISRFAAIEYEFEVEKSASLKSNRTITSEHSLTVQIYYNFNF